MKLTPQSLLFVILSPTLAVYHGPQPRRAVVRRMSSSVVCSSLTETANASGRHEVHSLDKKAFVNAEATLYNAGKGACGFVNGNEDDVVAISHIQFDAGKASSNTPCGRKLKITYQGKTKTATCVDRCQGCAYDHIDLTPSLFSYFAPLSKGVINVKWEWMDENDEDHDKPKSAVSKPKSNSSSNNTPSDDHFVATSTTSSATLAPTETQAKGNIQLLEQAIFRMTNLALAANVNARD